MAQRKEANRTAAGRAFDRLKRGRLWRMQGWVRQRTRHRLLVQTAVSGDDREGVWTMKDYEALSKKHFDAQAAKYDARDTV